MAVDREQSPQKLIYLRDHTAKSRSRPVRHERRGSYPPRPELASEALWLGRALLAFAAATLLYWLAVLTGVVVFQGGEAWHWTLSHGLAHLFLAASAGMAGRLLLQSAPRAPLFVAVAAGGLVVVALEGWARMLFVGGLSESSLSGRGDILTQATVLAAGIWAGSYALRANHQPD